MTKLFSFFSPCVKLYIPENIDYLFDIDKIKQTEQQLGSAIEKLEAALSLRDKCAEDLLRAVDEAERQLEMYTEIFTTAVTELKYKTRASLDSISKSLKTVFSEQKSVISEEVVCAKDILGKTKNANLESNNKSEQFACSALAAMARESCDGVNQRLFCPNVKEIVFKPNVATEELLKSLLLHSSFGEFSIVHTPQQINVWPYKVMCIDKLRIKARRHEDNTGIGGSCALQDGTVLLADRNNKCLKRLPPCGTSVSDCLQLPGSPRSITVINQTQVAVTLPYQTQVQVITLDKTMTKTRTFKTDFECRFIAHDNNELFLSDGIRMCVYTVAGKFLRQLFRKHMAETLSSGIRNMAMSSNGCVLFVADWEDGLIAIDRTSGRQLWCYTGEDLQGAWGVCVDGQGSLFISGNRSHNVLQFSESGEKIGDLLTESDGLLKPWSISFAANTRTLVVTRGYPNGNSVDIFRLAPVVEL